MTLNPRLGLLAALFVLLVIVLTPAGLSGEVRPAPIVIDARSKSPEPAPLPFPVGGQSPDGHVLSANSSYMTLDGKPWFPVMGEFHYSRYPEADWEQEILKMKAAGIQIISTYVFWIHHEEIEGQFDWTGQRNLRRFVELCAKHGLYVWIRIGPWDHGEVRNGGLPDWLVQKTATRENNPVYLDAVGRFYHEIGRQVVGLFWKDGGPILGVQIENEYSARGPGKGADHILRLRDLAREAGLDAPFYTITGWDNAVIPSRDVLPVFGGYADGFWWRSLEDLPPNPNYFFTKIRCEENVGDDLRSKRPDIDALNLAYPFFTAEMGGGMELSYHRRPLLSPSDTAAMEVVKLGSGVVLYGYYMFHGGTNPEGKKTTLQESQATGYPNDLPIKSYDFQAPLGEFGQMNPSYGTLKAFDLFLGDFGASLAPMTSYLPGRMPTGKRDTATPRVAARIQDDHGYIFVNNYERTYPLAEQKNFQVRLEFPSSVVDVPRTPVNVPSGAYAIWPVNLDAGGIRLRYATAQLLCKLDDPNTLVFFAWPGISPEFAFEEKDGTSIESLHGKIARERGIAYVSGIEPGTQVAIRVRQGNGTSVSIVVLSQEQALNTWKAKIAGRERLILSFAQLYFDHDQVHVVATEPSQLRAGFFPPPEHAGGGFVPDGENGIFKLYAARTQPLRISARVQKNQDAGSDPPLRMGKEMMGKEVALAPDDSAFETAASWAIQVPCVERGAGRVFLRIAYEGDVARFYVDGKLFSDNFYNGTPWLIGLDRIPCRQWDRLELKVLPLRNQAPIYLPAGARPAPSPSGEIVDLKEIETILEYESILDVKP
ncbi:MAG: beta-galactosidase [Acidobacteriia bacterium]|nr:beta-galactosidase [Terriglobia bacterium]